MSVSCECCVLSGRGLWDEVITRPEESYQLWCVVVCDLETSRMRRPWPTGGAVETKINKNPITGLDRPRGFQEVETPRFQDSRQMKVVRLSDLRTGRLYAPGNIPGNHFC